MASSPVAQHGAKCNDSGFAPDKNTDSHHYDLMQREEIARYAIDNSIEETAQKFSTELGHTVPEWKVIKFRIAYMESCLIDGSRPKPYKYEQPLREEIARYALKHGPTNAARQYSETLGHPVRHSTVARMRDSYKKKYNIVSRNVHDEQT